MKKSIYKKIAFIIAPLVLIYSSSIYANTIKYYKSYSINNWDYSVIGKDSLSAEEALQATCDKFTYNANGDLIQIEGSAYGLNYMDSYEKVYKICFEYKNNVFIKYFFNSDNKPTRNKKYGVFGEKIERLDNGYRLYFLNENGEKTVNNNKIYSILSITNESKNIIIQQYFDKNNIPVKGEFGAFKLKKIYDNKKSVIEIRYLDRNNKLVENTINYASEKIKYDNNKNIIERRYFDAQGNPAATFPYKISIQKKINKKWIFFDSSNEPISQINYRNVDLNTPTAINYNLVVELSAKDLLLNFIAVEANPSSVFYEDINIDKNILDSLLIQYSTRWYSKLDSLKDKGLIFKNGYIFNGFHSYIPENKLLVNEIVTMSGDSLKGKLRKLFLLNDTTAFNIINKYADPVTRFCYGELKVAEIIFFKWDDILFCVNPYVERTGGGYIDKLRKQVTVDFTKIPLSKDINHVFFEGVMITNFNPYTFYSNTAFYFNNCAVKSGEGNIFNNFLKPTEVAANEIIFYENSGFAFIRCSIDTLQFRLHSGYSMYPKRFYPTYNFSFDLCKIEKCEIFSSKYLRYSISQKFEHNIEFINCNIEQLDMSGYYTSLIFDNTKVKKFYAADVDLIEKEFKLINSSFESPLNFPNLILSESANFEMINTSYQAYMKFPWEQLKGKINLSIKQDVLKTYGNLYNLLSFNYKELSLIKDADDCYFYWKQFERENFGKFYWDEPGTHWYNPFDVAKAIGYKIFNNVNYFSCGYGVKPLWIFPFTIFIVCFFALIYFFVPTRISNLEEHLLSRDKIADTLRKMKVEQIIDVFSGDDFNFKKSKQGLIEDIISSIGSDELLERLSLKPKSRYTFGFFWYCVYFSFSTFTTIGIGDWYPSGKLNKALVMLEGALGWLCLGLFITTYANILLR